MFKYKLEPVLALKEKVEDNKKRELGVAIGQYEKTRKEEELLIEKKNMAMKLAQVQGEGEINLNQLKQFNLFSNYMNTLIEAKSLEVKQSARYVEEKRSELLSAVKERKILGNLKEIQFETYKAEEKREENRLLDEIVTYRFTAKKKEGE